MLEDLLIEPFLFLTGRSVEIHQGCDHSVVGLLDNRDERGAFLQVHHDLDADAGHYQLIFADFHGQPRSLVELLRRD